MKATQLALIFGATLALGVIAPAAGNAATGESGATVSLPHPFPISASKNFIKMHDVDQDSPNELDPCVDVLHTVFNQAEKHLGKYYAEFELTYYSSGELVTKKAIIDVAGLQQHPHGTDDTKYGDYRAQIYIGDDAVDADQEVEATVRLWHIAGSTRKQEGTDSTVFVYFN